MFIKDGWYLHSQPKFWKNKKLNKVIHVNDEKYIYVA